MISVINLIKLLLKNILTCSVGYNMMHYQLEGIYQYYQLLLILLVIMVFYLNQMELKNFQINSLNSASFITTSSILKSTSSCTFWTGSSSII